MRFFFRKRIHMIMTMLVIVITAALTFDDASGWGRDGHTFFNRTVVRHLPNQMILFIQDSVFFATHASDADNRRNSSDTSLFAEAPRHFMDIDDYPNFRNISRNLDTLIAQFGWERVKANGTNPWATVWNYDSLVAQLRRADWSRAKQTAADIGHYVGDAHQPLHNTRNYDGQYTNQRGIHARYESTMLSMYLSQLSVMPESVRYIHDRINYIFDYILHTNSLVDTVLFADTYAKGLSGGAYNSTYYNALWERTRRITLDQMQRGTVALASLWYSAWVDAGLISTSLEMPRVATTPVELSLRQNYPNPFNPATTIVYTLPVGGTVLLKVYSLEGKEVATLVNENQSAGEHKVQFSASPSLASGTYIYHLMLGNFSQTKKFVFLK